MWGPPERAKRSSTWSTWARMKRFADIIAVKGFDTNEYVVMATHNGIVKKTALAEYANPRSSGIIAISVPEDDELIGCQLTDGDV